MFGVQKTTLLNIFFIGSGKLAHNLAMAFLQTGDIHIAGVYSRTPAHAKAFAVKFKTIVFNEIKDIPANCDVYFLAVSDTAIQSISDQLLVTGIVVHCSGLMPLSALSAQLHKGVFWPVQTFSGAYELEFKNIPVCIEGNEEEDLKIIEAVAHRISKNVLRVKEKERQQLHLAAVVVNNFTNHLFVVAAKWLQENNLNFDLLKPLITETANKILKVPPYLAQTGPASRKDLVTIAKQEELLTSNPSLLKIYRLISSGIMDNIE
ncbi:MAG: DUF2520 domain-containing protein [Bacteroidia bacterium]|nr:DUF2520 domain-containing protein [Bacteroidia bacterium]